MRQRNLRQLKIVSQRRQQQIAALERNRCAVGQFDHFGFGSRRAEPAGNERKNFVCCFGIARGGRFVLRQAMNANHPAI